MDELSSSDNSFELNSIENVWALMKQWVKCLDPMSITDCLKEIQDFWDGISHEFQTLYIESMIRRVRLCVSANGSHINY